MTRKWPTQPRKTPRHQRLYGTFLPPAPDWTPPPERAYLPLPCVFRPPADPEVGPAIRTLKRALQRHRLLFLWYAHPVHVQFDADESPNKGDLYDVLAKSVGWVEVTRPADDIFEIADVLDEWLSEQQDALGTGHMVKRFGGDPWPPGPLAYWTFGPSTVTPLQESSDLIARLVGAALQPPRPDWLSPDDVPVVRACEPIALPAPTDVEIGHSWARLPDVLWDYPDRVQRQAESLERLVLLEHGASGLTSPPVTAKGSPSHNDDFTWVTFSGSEYRFNRGQGQIVRLLWKQYEIGGLPLSEQSIGEQIGSQSDRFRMLHRFRFRNPAASPSLDGEGEDFETTSSSYNTHPAWNTLIYSPEPGFFAIRDPRSGPPLNHQKITT